MDAEYTKLERELKSLTEYFAHSQISLSSEAQRKAAYERFMSKLRIINYPAIEQRQPTPFMYWLIEKYKAKGVQFIFEIFKMLHLIDYPFTKKNPDKLSLITYLSNLPEAITVLNFFFEKFPKKILLNQLDPFHPLLNLELNDELFVFLYQNFAKYNQPHVTAMNVAIMQKNHAVIDRIYRLFPSALNDYSSEGLNPLSQAVFTRCEATLDKVLSLNPDIDFTNSMGCTLGHMACQVEDDHAFVHKIIFDEKYAVLKLREKICSRMTRNVYEQLPLFITLIRGHYHIFEFILSEVPKLREEFFHIALNLIHLKDHTSLNYLYQTHHFSPYENSEFYSAFTNKLLLSKQYHILDWLCTVETVDQNSQKAFYLIKAIIEKNEAKIHEYLSDASIPWPALLPIISWKVTELLIENNYSHLISEYQLFERNIFFMSKSAENFQDNFLNIIPLPSSFHFCVGDKIDKQYQPLIEYFCDHIYRHQERYPKFIEHFTDPCIFVMSYVHDYNIRLNGIPLLHYFEAFLFMNVGRIEYIKRKQATVSKESIFEQMMTFYSKHIDVVLQEPLTDHNVKDADGLHIFAKLIQENQLIRISYLKEKQPLMSLYDLDPRVSNLLHLACENDHLDTVKWCVQAEINPVLARASDHLLPLEIAFEKRNMQIFNYLRKLVKPSTFLDVLKQLIHNGNDALLEHLVTNGFFGFKLSAYHKESIKKLQNHILNVFIASLDSNSSAAAAAATVDEEAVKTAEAQQISEPPPVILTAAVKKASINDAYLKTYRHLLTARSLDNLVGTTKQLKQEVYQEPLRQLFGSNIIEYVKKIQSADNPGLLKQFFRIPVVLELMANDDNWFKLALIAINTNKIALLDFILGQEDVKARLETRVVALFKEARIKPQIFSFLKQQFRLDIFAIQELIQFLIETDNQVAIRELLATNLIESIQQLITTSDIIVLRQFLTMPIVLEMMAVEDHWFELANLAIDLNRPDILQLILVQVDVKAQLQFKTIPLLQASLSKPELFNLLAITLELSTDVINHLIEHCLEASIQTPLINLLRPRILDHTKQMISVCDIEVLRRFFGASIVSELMGNDDNWFQLTNHIIRQNKPEILSLVLQQFDFRGREIEFLKNACSHTTSLSNLMAHFELSLSDLETLIEYAIEEDFREGLFCLLRHQHAEGLIQGNAMNLLMSSFEQNDAVLDFLLSKEYLHDMLEDQLFFFIKLAIFNKQPVIIEKLLSIDKLRAKFIETGHPFVRKLVTDKQTDLIPWFSRHSDLISFLSQFSELQLHICKRERVAQREVTIVSPQVIQLADFFEVISKNNLSLLSELLQACRRELNPSILMQIINFAISQDNHEAFKLLNDFSSNAFLNDQIALKTLLLMTITHANLDTFSYLMSQSPVEILNAAIDHDVFYASTSPFNPSMIRSLIRIPQYAYQSASYNHRLLKLAIRHHDLYLIQQILQIHQVKASIFEHRFTLVSEAFNSRNQAVLFHVLLNHVLFRSFFEHPHTSIKILSDFTQFFIESHQALLTKQDLHIVNLLKTKPELARFRHDLDTLKNRFFPPHERNHAAATTATAELQKRKTKK